jgi:hypothetical protein
MAKTRQKRKRKHRGTQAGTVTRPEPSRSGRGTGRGARGARGGKAGSATASRSDSRQSARERRLARLDEPPTWRGSFNRAAIAAAVVTIIAVVLLERTVAQALFLGVFMLAVYIPLGYVFDTFLYRMRQRRKRR